MKKTTYTHWVPGNIAKYFKCFKAYPTKRSAFSKAICKSWATLKFAQCALLLGPLINFFLLNRELDDLYISN